METSTEVVVVDTVIAIDTAVVVTDITSPINTAVMLDYDSRNV